MSDEKRAFEAMMAEVEDSDSDDDQYKSSKKKSTRSTSSNSSGNRPKSSQPMRGESTQGNITSAGGLTTSTSSIPINNSAQPKSQSILLTSTSEMSKIDQEIMNFGENKPSSKGNTSNMPLTSQSPPVNKNWLMRPCPPNESPLLCYIERDRSTFSSLNGHIIYRLYLEIGSEKSRFLLSAKKIINKRTSYYLLSTEFEPNDDRGSDDVLGKLRANTIGSRYLLTDSGIAPDRSVAPSMHRKELGIIRFDFDSDGPSQIQAYIPIVNSAGIAMTWQPDSEEGSIESCVERNEVNRLLLLKNKKPKWDESHGGHVLNFQGRVTESSVKNFQLICESLTGEEVTLQFGRVGKNKFTMDVKYPLSLYQAFGMCVACMDGKIADRKGYEFVKKITETFSSDSKK